ncbi:MAG: M3 family metallopeptidase [Bacteroides sp.]|nr:M3 family metallopeptidase [Bacteroides sp.]MBD5339872.1 M3 family metallopeptidase [Bacteroides sp.]
MTFASVAQGFAEYTGSNPLLQTDLLPYGAIPFDRLTPELYEQAVKEAIALQNQNIAAIVNQRSVPTFENTIVALDRSGDALNRAVLALSNVEHAVGDPAMMQVLSDVTPLLSEHEASIMLNEGLWQRIKQVYDRRDQIKGDLTPEDLRLLDETYKSFALNGAALEGADRDKYRKLNGELSDLNVKFSQNVTNGMADPDRRLWVSREDLDGLSDDLINAAREEAKAALLADGKPDDESLYLITVYFPSYSPFMKYAKNRDLREKMYKIYSSRNNGGKYNNLPLLVDISNVRLELANLMGKENFAEYQLQHTMAENPENVYTMLNELREAYEGPMRAELEEIQNFARQTEGPDFVLMPWDYSFWSDKLKASKYAFNDEDMKPYFELNNTIKGVFGLATKLYGYTFKLNEQIPGYHDDVKVYDVYGPDKKLLGILYTDFFYRPGKAPGAWMTEYQTEVKDDEGNRTLPLISIVCNFSKPVGDKAVLLTPYEVETFLHEFGHALHGLSAQAKYSSLSGTNVYHDFVELFSQFNENYLTEQEFLDSFAKHYQTGKKMPKELLERFIKASQFGAAYSCMRQLNFGFLDMAYHMQKDPMRATQDIAAFENEAIAPVMIFEPVEDCLISPAFTHVFSGGYAAGYYGYKWSEELDADAFAAFKETGNIFDKKTADKFHKMLESGGTVDPMELYIEFRGKKPTVDALLVRDGIKK